MLKLCGFRISNYFNKVRLVLLEKGIEHEEDPSHFPSQDESFRQHSPMGKVPFLVTDQGVLCESHVICEYIEDTYPEKPLLPRDPYQRAKVRELIQVMELHIELVARKLYAELFGQKVSAEKKAEVQLELEKGLRAFSQLVKFSPYLAGPEFTLADCAAAVHFPLISMATKTALGRDVLEALPQVPEYLSLIKQRATVQQINTDRKAAVEAMAARRAAAPAPKPAS